MDSNVHYSVRNHSSAATDHETDPLRELVLNATGLSFEARHRGVLRRAVRHRMQALGIGSAAAYHNLVRRHPEGGELQRLLQLLTVGETHFFRYPDQFRALAALVAQERSASDPIRCWSAGSSTGEEPYSIAIALMEALPDWRERDIAIYATDINEVSLQRGREGVYTPWSLRSTPPCYLERYFDPAPEGYRVKECVKSLVRFSPLNLNAPRGEGELPQALAGLDAIFCRNVMIYFAPSANQKLLHAFSRALKPQGLLFLGHAETIPKGCGSWWRRRHENSFFYQNCRREEGAAESAEQEAPRPERRPQPEEPTREQRRGSARLLLEVGDLAAAAPLLDRLIREDGNDFQALTLMGFLEVRRGRPREAIAWCDRALRVNDLFPDAYFLRGIVLAAIGTPTEALREYRRALLLDRALVMARYHLARLYLKLGKAKHAAREMGNGVKILGKGEEEETVPYSWGLSPRLCLLQFRSALAQIATVGAAKEVPWGGETAATT